MSLHRAPHANTTEIVKRLRAHGMDPNEPDQLADAFRLGFLSAHPEWKPQRCAECDCEFGGADCSWIRAAKAPAEETHEIGPFPVDGGTVVEYTATKKEE